MKNKNRTAFPSSSGDSDGLTKLEYFAGLAMQGLLANDPSYMSEIVAERAIEFAEALIKELGDEADED